MPIYQFECECGNYLEDLFPHPLESIKCSVCGQEMHKIISLTNFQLKGPGWAATRYDKVKLDVYGNKK